MRQVMRYALVDILAATGWQVEAFGRAGAHVVTGRAPGYDATGRR